MNFRLKRFRLREDDVERACIDLLRLRAWWVARLHSGTFKSVDNRRWIKGHDKGTPDYACLHERFPGFLLEVKRPGEKLSREQTMKHIELQVGYRLAIVVVDSAAGLLAWLDQHEMREEK
jgi:hypothetical protein